jgi:hypothetical protein
MGLARGRPTETLPFYQLSRGKIDSSSLIPNEGA